MKRTKYILITLLTGLFFSCVYAQQKVLTLQDCINIALKNSYELKSTEQKMLATKYNKLQATSKFLPSISFTASYTKLSEVPEFITATPQLMYRSDLGGFIITGYEQQSLKFGGEETRLARASLTQPLFTGGKILNSYWLASYSYEIMKEEYNRVKTNLTLNVKKAFYSVLLAEKFVKIAEESYEVLKNHYKVTESLYKEGKISSFDLSRVKVQLVNCETDVIKAKNGLELAKKYLLNLINYKEEEQDISFEGSLETELIELKELSYYIDQALKNRPEIKQLNYQQKISELSLKLAISENLPNISFVTSYDYQKPYYFSDDWKNVSTIMLVLNYPLFDGLWLTNYSKIKSSKHNLEQTKFNKKQIIDMIKLEVEKTYLNIIEAKKRINVQKENVNVAKENLRIAQDRYKQGLISDLDVRDTQLALTQAKLNYYQAIFDYIMAKEELLKNIGNLQEEK